ncbi:hypothetical protein McanMca71_004382 [Microsporum canis]|uniref:Anaphase promoting complex subunit 11 n=1 Tax=Arthroderma otae (strain ATCC MYA-4605 / CBS 113480) TaxID=554155 RepID=C5FG18_ARTOC|nr:conserved hypothetical protein [Microsporum canis CBS 113480]EEQ29703.1 conserved hypothetical protein [Microsporum canis CBS 113480]
MSLPKDPTSPAALSPKVAGLSFSPTEYDTSSQPPQSSHGNQEEQQDEDESGHVSQTHETVEDTSAPVHPPFRPLFTVIGDATSSEYFHPTVHYIFSDDDTGIITEAALQSLEASNQRTSWDTESTSQKEKKKGKSAPKAETTTEHFIILDVEPTNGTGDTTAAAGVAKNDSQETSGCPNPTLRSIQDFKVTSAHSLSPAWQVINTTLSPAPNFDSSSNSPTSTDRDGNTVLMIEGTSGFASDGMSGRHQAQQGQAQTLEEMMDQFARRMAELKKVVEASGDHIFAQVVEHAERPEDNP